MDALGIAASGLGAATTILNATANNIVNADTPGYDAETVDLADDPTGGVSVQGIDRTDHPPDLATETVEEKTTVMMYDANAAVIRVADQMYGSLLNVLDTENQNVNPDGTRD
jgi:flagellar hook protein FlgE